MNRQSMNNPQRHGTIGRSRECLLNPGLQNLAAVDHGLDIWNRLEGCVLFQIVPVLVVGNQSRRIFRQFLIQQPFHGNREGFQDLPLFNHRDPLEGVNVIGMNGKQIDELVHALVHMTIKTGEWRQIGTDAGLLFGCLAKQSPGDDELDILAGNQKLFEAVLDPADIVSHEREPRAAKNGFLNAGHESKPQVFADFPNFTQEAQIKDQFLILARTQIVQQLIHHQQQTMIREPFMESSHHLFEGSFVVGHCRCIWKPE